MWNMWGLAWQIWVMIGVTVLLLFGLSVVIELYLKLRKYSSKQAQRDREEQDLRIQNLKRGLDA